MIDGSGRDAHEARGGGGELSDEDGVPGGELFDLVGVDAELLDFTHGPEARFSTLGAGLSEDTS